MIEEPKTLTEKSPKSKKFRYSATVLCRNFVPVLIKKYPRLSKYTRIEITAIIKAFHDACTDEILVNRFGVELPERFGVIMVGNCPAAKKSRTMLQRKAGGGFQTIGLVNMNTDTRIAKIFFTNFEGRYNYRHKEIFRFKADENFRGKVSQAFKTRHNVFLEVPARINIVQLLKSFKGREAELNRIERERPTYNEFEVDK